MKFKNSFLVTNDNLTLIGTIEVRGHEKVVPSSKLILECNHTKHAFKLSELKFLLLKTKETAFNIYYQGEWFKTDSSNYSEFNQEWLKCISRTNEVKA